MKVIAFILGSVICFLVPITVVNFVTKCKVENELVNLKHKHDELSKNYFHYRDRFDDINTKYLILCDESKKLKIKAGIDAVINGGKKGE
jgi:hypothetical protein